MIRLALALILAAMPVRAGDTVTWGADAAAWLSLGPTSAPGAVAELTFHNENRHSGAWIAAPVEWQGLSVGVTLEIDIAPGPGAAAPTASAGAPDRITATPPDGYVAVPPEAVVDEGATQVILIYPVSGFGV